MRSQSFNFGDLYGNFAAAAHFLHVLSSVLVGNLCSGFCGRSVTLQPWAGCVVDLSSSVLPFCLAFSSPEALDLWKQRHNFLSLRVFATASSFSKIFVNILSSFSKKLADHVTWKRNDRTQTNLCMANSCFLRKLLKFPLIQLQY